MSKSAPPENVLILSSYEWYQILKNCDHDYNTFLGMKERFGIESVSYEGSIHTILVIFKSPEHKLRWLLSEEY